MSEILIRDGVRESPIHKGMPKIGTAFRGNVNGNGSGTFIATFLGVIQLNPGLNNQGTRTNFINTWSKDAPIEISNYREVDLDIIVREK